MSKLSYDAELMIENNRKLVLDAFKAIRRQGFRARANFRCCSGCAAAAGDPSDLGMAYWHRQNEDLLRRKGILNIGFFNEDGDETKNLKLAHTLVDELIQRGLHVTWSGSTDEKIEVALAIAACPPQLQVEREAEYAVQA